MQDRAAPKPRKRNRAIVILLVLLPCVALVSCLSGGVVTFAFRNGLHPNADVDALLAAIDAGEFDLSADLDTAFLIGGHGCPGWGPVQSNGHEFMASLFRDDSRSITVYFMDERVIAAQGHNIDYEADTWYFIDLDKFTAYLDANTGGRVTSSAPPDPQN